MQYESNTPISLQERLNYVDYICKQCNCDRTDITSLKVTIKDDDTAELEYEVKGPKFERIRRITGYLVGTIDRWNNAKRAEEHERVKHDAGNVA